MPAVALQHMGTFGSSTQLRSSSCRLWCFQGKTTSLGRLNQTCECPRAVKWSRQTRILHMVLALTHPTSIFHLWIPGELNRSVCGHSQDPSASRVTRSVRSSGGRVTFRSMGLPGRTEKQPEPPWHHPNWPLHIWHTRSVWD